MGYHKASEWKGLTRWECDEGDFESTVESRVAEHAETAHVPKQRVTDVLGPKGERLKVEEPSSSSAIPATERDSSNTGGDQTAPGAESEESDTA